MCYTCFMGAWKSKNRHKYLLQYHIIADDMDPEKDTRVQELVLLERQENDEYQISEIGAEINIIGEGNKEPRQAE